MLRTAECVSPMHPDKMCDQISDAILDAVLEQDPCGRVAVEAMGGHGKVCIIGEVTANADVDYKEIGRRISGVDLVQVRIVQQSNYIANGVDSGGAGDQGIMVGYACSDNEARIPMEVRYSRSLCQRIYAEFPYDGKTQVSMHGDKIVNVTASFQNVSKEKLEDAIHEWLWAVAHDNSIATIYANPAGDWSTGGFDADTGLTGRKIVVDAYGPYIPVGGGAFSGKDPTKVDRSGAYMARYIALQYLSRREAKEVKTFISYAIGKKYPTMALVVVDGKEELILGYDMRPQAIIERFDLRRPMYLETAKWGHFGNGFPWDAIDV